MNKSSGGHSQMTTIKNEIFGPPPPLMLNVINERFVQNPFKNVHLNPIAIEESLNNFSLPLNHQQTKNWAMSS